jgi:predicted O-methyltransferase YrrM
VLEFGAGQSTLWWLARGADVISFEDDAGWVQRIRHKVPRADVRLVDRALQQFPDELRAETFDVVMIDGMRRQVAAAIGRTAVASGGCIIQDNSEGYWSDEPGRYEIVELLADFARVDLYGFSPGAWRRHCTSIYFRGSCFLFQNPRPPVRLD